MLTMWDNLHKARSTQETGERGQRRASWEAGKWKQQGRQELTEIASKDRQHYGAYSQLTV